jgi:uncharacterized protein YaaN involved in tellurite resistance
MADESIERAEVAGAGAGSIEASDEVRAQAQALRREVDLGDSTSILNFGVTAQKKMGGVAESALSSVRTKDLGPIGDTMSGLIATLKGFDPQKGEARGLAGLFKKAGGFFTKLQARYTETAKNVDKIEGILRGHQTTLQADIKMLDALYEKNKEYFNELTAYIVAGEEVLIEARLQLETRRAAAQASGDQNEINEVSRYAAQIESFERRVHDLKLTRTVALQSAPQIQVIQAGDAEMTRQITTLIQDGITIWKQQMMLQLGLQHQRVAIDTAAAVSAAINESLRQTADATKQGALDIAKAQQEGVVSIEALEHTNRQLISMVEEVRVISEQGRVKRAEAEVRLQAIEGEIQQKLLEA